MSEILESKNKEDLNRIKINVICFQIRFIIYF